LDILPRINELSKLARQRDLTPEETTERETLRAEFRRRFRANFQDSLSHIDIEQPDGTIVPLTEQKKDNPQ